MQQPAIQDKIYEIRGRKVILEDDLALLYGIKTKVLHRTVKRYADRFPADDLLLLSEDEYRLLHVQRQDREYNEKKDNTPVSCAFTERGITLLVNILKNEKLIHMDTEFAMRYFRVLYHMHSESPAQLHWPL